MRSTLYRIGIANSVGSVEILVLCNHMLIRLCVCVWVPDLIATVITHASLSIPLGTISPSLGTKQPAVVVKGHLGALDRGKQVHLHLWWAPVCLWAPQCLPLRSHRPLVFSQRAALWINLQDMVTFPSMVMLEALHCSSMTLNPHLSW